MTLREIEILRGDDLDEIDILLTSLQQHAQAGHTPNDVNELGELIDVIQNEIYPRDDIRHKNQWSFLVSRLLSNGFWSNLGDIS